MKNVSAFALCFLAMVLTGCSQATSAGSGNSTGGTATLVTNLSITAGSPSSGTVTGSQWAVVNQNATLQLSVTVLPANATNQTVTWTSSSPSTVSVGTSGLVTTVGYSGSGGYVITATANDGSGKSATFTVNFTGG
jgi:hypothetical protein